MTSASTKTMFFPVRNTSARQKRFGPEAGRRKETLFSTVIRSRSLPIVDAAAPPARVVRKGHEHASMDESMLLAKKGGCVQSRFTPTRTIQGQLNPQRTDEFSVLKDSFHQANRCIVHLYVHHSHLDTLSLHPRSLQVVSKRLSRPSPHKSVRHSNPPSCNHLFAHAISQIINAYLRSGRNLRFLQGRC
jgi:hypothetical protein